MHVISMPQLTPLQYFSPQEQLLFHLHSLARELGPSSWMMLDALVPKPDLWTVLIGELACITVFTLKMLVFDVEVSKSACHFV